jgi:hypothetical protein
MLVPVACALVQHTRSESRVTRDNAGEREAEDQQHGRLAGSDRSPH